MNKIWNQVVWVILKARPFHWIKFLWQLHNNFQFKMRTEGFLPCTCFLENPRWFCVETFMKYIWWFLRKLQQGPTCPPPIRETTTQQILNFTSWYDWKIMRQICILHMDIFFFSQWFCLYNVTKKLLFVVKQIWE